MWDRIAYIIAGPPAMHANMLEVARWARLCWQAGWAAIWPHKNAERFDGILNVPQEAFIKGDLLFLGILRPRIDAVVMLPGWQNTEGAQAKHAAAGEHELIVVYCETFDSNEDLFLGYMQALQFGEESAVHWLHKLKAGAV